MARPRTSELNRDELSSSLNMWDPESWWVPDRRDCISLCELPWYHTPKPEQREVDVFQEPSELVLLWFSSFPTSSVPRGKSWAGNPSRGKAMAGRKGNNSHYFLQWGHNTLKCCSLLLQGRWGDASVTCELLGLLASMHGRKPCPRPQASASIGWHSNLALSSVWKPSLLEHAGNNFSYGTLYPPGHPFLLLIASFYTNAGSLVLSHSTIPAVYFLWRA